MRRLLGLLTGTCAFVLVGAFAWTHRPKMSLESIAAPPLVKESAERHLQDPVEAAATGMVTIDGPLANYMKKQQGIAGTADASAQSSKPIFNEADKVGDSPVGTSSPLLHKTFTIAKAANLPFEIPAYAASARLHGTFLAFLPAGSKTGDEADVEFSLMNQQQYTDLLNQRPADALFSAEGAHDQEVNFTLPPTINKPVKYYLVFQNGSTGAAKVAVQADFRVDY